MSKKKDKQVKGLKEATPVEQFLQRLHSMDLQDGNLTDQDALALIKLTKSVAEKSTHSLKLLEVGPWKGKSTACLALVASKYPNGKVYSIDHFKGSPNTRDEKIAKENDILSIFKNNIKTINAQDIICLLNMDIKSAAISLREGSFDLVFIDYDNMYLAMQEAIDYANSWVRVGGIICGRNMPYTSYNEIEKIVEENIVREYSPEHKIHPGIVKAVYEAFRGGHQIIEGSSIWWWQK
jgi:predicted O-methyltransferase YrrM